MNANLFCNCWTIREVFFDEDGIPIAHREPSEDIITKNTTASNDMVDCLFKQRNELLKALEYLVQYDFCSTEYDGRVINLCPSCGRNEDHYDGCEFKAAKCLITKVKEMYETI